MNNNISEDEMLERKKTEIEKIMLELDPADTERQHKAYLSGYIDNQYDRGEISDNVRGQLYEIYAF